MLLNSKLRTTLLGMVKLTKIRNTEDQEKEQLLKYIEKVKNTANFMANDRLRKDLFEAEYKLNSILDLETQGLITRSRAQ